MVNFENSKIYKIIDNTNGNVYIGSTCEPTLARRLAKHRSNYKQYCLNNYNHTTSFEILKNNDYEIVLLEKCNNITCKDELYSRERYYIENNNCINKYIPNRTKKEHYKDNRNEILECRKQYYEENKNEILERQQKYKDKNKYKIEEQRKQKIICDICGSKISKCCLAKHKRTNKCKNSIKS